MVSIDINNPEYFYLEEYNHQLEEEKKEYDNDPRLNFDYLAKFNYLDENTFKPKILNNSKLKHGYF